MPEKKSFTIVNIKENPWTDKNTGETKIYYNCTTSTGEEYSTTDAQVKQYLNQNHEFEINEKNGKKYINFNKPGYGGSGKKQYIPTFKDSKEAAVLSAKTMTLSYSKDIVSKMVEAQMIKPVDAWDVVLAGYKKLVEGLALDSIKEPVLASSASTGPIPATPKSTLKPVLVTILQGKMRNKNFRAGDMIDFAGAMCGIELKYDPQTDDIIWDISETDAHNLIDALGK